MQVDTGKQAVPEQAVDATSIASSHILKENQKDDEWRARTSSVAVKFAIEVVRIPLQQ
jgi:hypothetical protein